VRYPFPVRLFLAVPGNGSNAAVRPPGGSWLDTQFARATDVLKNLGHERQVRAQHEGASLPKDELLVQAVMLPLHGRIAFIRSASKN
jgi:hypothetical protein